MVIKKIVFFVFIIFSLFIINDLVHSIYNLWQKNNLIDRGKHALSVEKDKNAELKSRLKVVIQPQFIEEEARNKLFLVRPGEGIVVVAPTEYLRVSSSASVGYKDERPNWKQWWEMFF
jgi:cell division protein FtsB